MNTAHILKIGSCSYALTSISEAVKIVALLSKGQPCDHVTRGAFEDWHYTPDERPIPRVELLINQPFHKPSKSPRLPSPRRGSKRCLCGHSDVSPGHTCPSCGLAFQYS